METYPSDNNGDQNYKMTGKMVPVPKDNFMSFVYEALNEFKQKLLAGDPNPTPNPLTESLFITNGERTIMIPHDVQNEAITKYLRQDPQLKAMVGVDDPLESEASGMGHKPLIDSRSFNVDTDNDTDDEGEVRTETDDELDDDSDSGGIGKMTIILCVVIALFLLFMFGNRIKIE